MLALARAKLSGLFHAGKVQIKLKPAYYLSRVSRVQRDLAKGVVDDGRIGQIGQHLYCFLFSLWKVWARGLQQARRRLLELLQLLGKPGKYTLEQLLCTFCLCRAECKLVPEAVSSLACGAAMESVRESERANPQFHGMRLTLEREGSGHANVLEQKVQKFWNDGLGFHFT